MIIILEGPDCAGKSTLGSALGQRFHVSVQHQDAPKPDENVFRFFVKNLDRAVNSTSYQHHGVAILDRFFHSELVYGPILRNSNGLSATSAGVIADLVTQQDPAVRLIYCRPPTEVILRKWWTRVAQGKELVTDEQKMRDIISSYDRLMRGIQPAPILYDYSRNPMAEQDMVDHIATGAS